jgi:hypothetical protein
MTRRFVLVGLFVVVQPGTVTQSESRGGLKRLALVGLKQCDQVVVLDCNSNSSPRSRCRPLAVLIVAIRIAG